MSIAADPLAKFKEVQRQGWSHFAPVEVATTIPAGRLVDFAGVKAGQKVLDVACGTGVVAVTAARRGARVWGLDLTPELLARARENAAIASVNVDWKEGDAEALPYGDGEFDVVMSQFGHMFAPRPDVTLAEMLRVLKPGGMVAFSTWPPEHLVGGIFALVGRYMPPPPAGVSPPSQWGDIALVRQRIGTALKDVVFDRGVMAFPALSVAHNRILMEQTAGPMRKMLELLANEPAKIAAFRAEYDALATPYLRDNVLESGYLMTRGVKV